MSQIRCIYHGAAPEFPAADQHPQARRYGPVTIDGVDLFVDAIGGAPSREDVIAVLRPVEPPAPTPAEKLAAAGLSVAELKALLALPTLAAETAPIKAMPIVEQSVSEVRSARDLLPEVKIGG